ncbi:hypothetical protein GE300_04665 [Rhodobacteraceae bacterium 2CG4]|uniref:Uncharacterized protein n=1 Tax=Halovulum marinum TaxID=2662447 RepID=A0A6L5YYJ3_9RHOB|nr:hypothetical protein [Halovulum marinum]MSU88915.1 hypothetical protein [Halovulum marinum]
MGILSWLVSAVLLGVPLYRLLPRAGMNPLLALLALVPFAGIVVLWIIAFRSWPGDNVSERF